MRLSQWLVVRLRDRLMSVSRRPPDFVIGSEPDPYLRRWWVIPRNRWFNVYLHQFCRSDDDRALHDHPWVNLSVILAGSYAEHTIDRGGIHRRTTRARGDVVLRLPSAAHRVELLRSVSCLGGTFTKAHTRCCWTLFITGPTVRQWGFHCRGGWVHWEKFTDHATGGRGAGCGEFE